MCPIWPRRPNWEKPGTTNWVDARKAFFVIGSRMKGGMGADEAVPFSAKEAAETFASENGGRVLAFAEVPEDYVLSATAETTSSVEEGHVDHEGHGAPASPQGRSRPLGNSHASPPLPPTLHWNHRGRGGS